MRAIPLYCRPPATLFAPKSISNNLLFKPGLIFRCHARLPPRITAHKRAVRVNAAQQLAPMLTDTGPTAVIDTTADNRHSICRNSAKTAQYADRR